MFESGLVWRPDFQWADEMAEECASFPFGDNDDLVDSMSQAILRFREGGFVRHPSDELWDEDRPRQKEYY
jgi:phage terminase large subunit-like protein